MCGHGRSPGSRCSAGTRLYGVGEGAENYESHSETLAALKSYGLRVNQRIPIVPQAHGENAGYLEAKRDKLGHLLAG